VLSNGKECHVSVTLAEQPKIQAAQDQGGPLLVLDTGGHMALINGLAFTPEGKQLVSASDDKVIRVWDLQAGKTVRTIRGQVGPGDEGKIYAMALSPDGRWLATGGWFNKSREEDIRLYDFTTGNLVALLKGHTNAVASMAFSPDGTRLISGSGDNSAIIWDIDGRKLLHRLQGHTAEIYAVAFMPDGERVVTGSYDTTLRLWRATDGGLIAELKGHKDKVHSLALRSSDSMGDTSGEVRLWDGGTGQFLRTLFNQGGNVGSLRFSPDGRQLLPKTSFAPAHPLENTRSRTTKVALKP
jgi:WD40 repeat protein